MNEREELEALRRLAELEKKAAGSDAKAAARAAPGWVQGLASVAQGPTFGFADELGGLVGGAKSALTGGDFSSGYTGTRDTMREMADIQAKENPITTLVTRGMASAPTFLLGGPTKAVSGMLPNMLQAGKTATAMGAVSGAGSSTADSALGVVADSAKGATIGGLTGMAAVPVQRGMGGMYDVARARFSDSAAMKYAQEKVAEALVRDARGRAIQASPTAPFTQATSRLRQLGDEARVVDAGGQNARQLLDTVATLPGQSKNATEAAIRARQATRADRLIGSAERSLGTNGDRAAQVVDDLVRTRQQAATPLYGRLHQMEVQADPALAQTLAAAEQLGAGKVAKDIATAAEMPYSLSAAEWSASGGRLSMRDLDHMKQGIDTLIAKNTDMAGKVSPLGFRLQGLRDRLVSRLDDATGGFYKEARDAFAGPSALIDATTKGRRFMTADDASTRQALSGLSTSEQEAFRLGAFEALRNKLGRPGGQTEVMGLWKDKILGEKLKTIFPNERAYREFASSISREGSMKGLESVGRGSQTAARQYAAGDLDVSALANVVQTASGAGTVPGFLTAAGQAWNRVKTPEAVRDQMGNILLQQGPAGRRQLADLENALLQIQRQRSQTANALGVGAGQYSGPLANALMP